MIAQLRGLLVRKTPQEAVVDVGGVGYRVQIPVSTFYRLPEVGTETTLLTHTHVREDTLALFGFGSADEQLLFEHLIAVAGVGPRLAVSILSGMDAASLADALSQADVARLTRIPGVGKKTAERLVLELREKVAKLHVAGEERPSRATHPAADDVVSALGNLGYSRQETEKVVDRVIRNLGDTARFEDVLRQALTALASR